MTGSLLYHILLVLIYFKIHLISFGLLKRCFWSHRTLTSKVQQFHLFLVLNNFNSVIVHSTPKLSKISPKRILHPHVGVRHGSLEEHSRLVGFAQGFNLTAFNLPLLAHNQTTSVSITQDSIFHTRHYLVLLTCWFGATTAPVTLFDVGCCFWEGLFLHYL